MKARRLLVLLWIFVCVESRAQPNSSLTLNESALEFARQLIRKDRVILDKKGAWQKDKPSGARENQFIRVNGFAEYSKWHLGIDNRSSPKSKAHYKFPFGDFNALHRCGLLAVKARAHEFGYSDVESAADQLLAEIESNRPKR